MTYLKCGSFNLPLQRPLVMGIVNLTPDSFSGDGLVGCVDKAIAHARTQFEAGADILDIGAESTRPGAIPTSASDELARLIPVLGEVTRWGVPVSVDTYKPVVMQAALAAGASMINDIAGMRDPDALAAIADSDCGVCVMHMQGMPLDMQQAPVYGDVVTEVRSFLADAVGRCRRVGVEDERLLLDPGFGFGKTLAHNLALFQMLTATTTDSLPLLVGVSRKSMLGAITGRPVEERLAASVAAAVMAAMKGAAVVRVHDVAATKDALAVCEAIEKGGL